MTQKLEYDALAKQVDKITFGNKEYDTPEELKNDYVKFLQLASQSADALEKAATFKKNTGLKTEKQRAQYNESLKIAQEFYDKAENLKLKTDAQAKKILGVNDYSLANAQKLVGDAVQKSDEAFEAAKIPKTISPIDRKTQINQLSELGYSNKQIDEISQSVS